MKLEYSLVEALLLPSVVVQTQVELEEALDPGGHGSQHHQELKHFLLLSSETIPSNSFLTAFQDEKM